MNINIDDMNYMLFGSDLDEEENFSEEDFVVDGGENFMGQWEDKYIS